jgi:hypothetical protein
VTASTGDSLLDPGQVPAHAGRQVHAQARDTLWNGRKIHFYGVQFRYWALIVGIVGATGVAGAYFGLWEVHWYLPFGPAWMQRGMDLKPWWDRGSWWPGFLGHWDLYRHAAFRNQLEPGIGGLLALSVMSKAKWWGYRVSTVSIGIRMILVLAITIGLGVLGVWLSYFGMPWLWAHIFTAAGKPGYNLDGAFSWAGKSSLFILVWGIGVMAQAAHRIWAPAGATIQGFALDRSADRARDLTAADRKQDPDAADRIPTWVRQPVAPPNLRLRWSGLYLLPDNGKPLQTAGPVKRTAIRVILAAFAWLFLLGLIGHYVVGVFGVHVPYLAP